MNEALQRMQKKVDALSDSERASGSNEVLTALDKLSTRLRQRLGESLSALSKTNVPMPKATTASLEALRLYTARSARPGATTGQNS